jgi:hypothetical protein
MNNKMYKKIYSEKIDDRYKEEMNDLTVYVRENQIENPIIKYFKLNKNPICNDILIINQNGFNFLEDNYPIYNWGLEEIKDEEIITDNYVWINGDVEMEIKIVLKGYKEYHYDSENNLIEKKDYSDNLLGIDKWGNLTFWDNQKQTVIHQKQFIGSSGNLNFNYKRIKLTKNNIKNYFNDYYFEETKRRFFGR